MKDLPEKIIFKESVKTELNRLNNSWSLVRFVLSGCVASLVPFAIFITVVMLRQVLQLPSFVIYVVGIAAIVFVVFTLYLIKNNEKQAASKIQDYFNDEQLVSQFETAELLYQNNEILLKRSQDFVYFFSPQYITGGWRVINKNQLDKVIFSKTNYKRNRGLLLEVFSEKQNVKISLKVLYKAGLRNAYDGEFHKAVEKIGVLSQEFRNKVDLKK